MPVLKETYLWGHGDCGLVEHFGPESNPKYICSDESPCQFRRADGSHPGDVKGHTKEHTPYPEALCQVIGTVVNAHLSWKRRKARLE